MGFTVWRQVFKNTLAKLRKLTALLTTAGLIRKLTLTKIPNKWQCTVDINSTSLHWYISIKKYRIVPINLGNISLIIYNIFQGTSKIYIHSKILYIRKQWTIMYKIYNNKYQIENLQNSMGDRGSTVVKVLC
jgi:hypothetical protein